MSDIFVDAVAGNDAWNGLYARFVSGSKGPKKTLQAGGNAIPNALGGHRVITAPRGNAGTLYNVPYAGTSGAWNEIIGDTNVTHTDPDGQTFDCAPGPVVLYGRVNIGGSNYACVSVNQDFLRFRNLIAVNPGATTADFGIACNFANGGEYAHCVGIASMYGLLVNMTGSSTPEHGGKILGCVGVGAPGIYTASVGTTVRRILVDNSVAWMFGASFQAQYEAALLVDTGWTTIRDTAAVTGLLNYTGVYCKNAFRGGAGGKAEFIRAVAQGFVAATNFQSGSTWTGCQKFGPTETNWNQLDKPPYLFTPQLYPGSPIADLLAHLPGLAGGSAYDLLGFDRSAASETPGPVEYVAGRRLAGYPGYKDGRGIGWLGDLEGGGAFPTVGGSIVRGRI